MNSMKITFDAISENESFARLAVAGFLLYKNPSINDIEDIKTAVSEAVTNSIIHGYNNNKGKIDLYCSVIDNHIEIEVVDYGEGIEDISQAMKPMYTSKPEEERSGLGFTVMGSFMDKIDVESKLGKGTKVKLYKDLV
ncbi:MAG: anti-sigma F factor [Lachnospirales bacterium]